MWAYTIFLIVGIISQILIMDNIDLYSKEMARRDLMFQEYPPHAGFCFALPTDQNIK